MAAAACRPCRRLTVQTLVNESGGGHVWKPYRYTRPWIRLTGKWLADAGFHAGDTVVVTVHDGRLIVEKTPIQSEDLTHER